MTVRIDDELRDYLAQVREQYSVLLEMDDETLAERMAILTGLKPPVGDRAMRAMTGRYRDHLVGVSSGPRMTEYTKGWEHGFASAAKILADEMRLDVLDTNRTWIEGILR